MFYSLISLLVFSDVTKFNSFDSVVSKVSEIVGEKGLTLLINNAGTYGIMGKLEKVDPAVFIKILTTNTVGPVVVTKVRDHNVNSSVFLYMDWNRGEWGLMGRGVQ